MTIACLQPRQRHRDIYAIEKYACALFRVATYHVSGDSKARRYPDVTAFHLSICICFETRNVRRRCFSMRIWSILRLAWKTTKQRERERERAKGNPFALFSWLYKIHANVLWTVQRKYYFLALDWNMKFLRARNKTCSKFLRVYIFLYICIYKSVPQCLLPKLKLKH